METGEAQLLPQSEYAQPLRVIPYELHARSPLAEFQQPGDFNLVSEKEAKVITAFEPSLVSDGFAKCQAVLLRSRDQSKYGLAHDLGELNLEQLEEIDKLGKEALAIIIRGYESYPSDFIQRQLAAKGIAVARFIALDTGHLHWAVAYRQKENKIYIENQHLGDLEVFEGFPREGKR
jgi:hypothetical protein